MRRSYKFQLRPTRKQEAALSACLEDTRQLYNAALEERREAWRMGRLPGHLLQPGRAVEGDQGRRPGAVRALGLYLRAGRDPPPGPRLPGASSSRVKAGEKPGYPGSRGAAGGTPSNGRGTNGARWDSVPAPHGHPGLPQGHRPRPRPPAPPRQGPQSRPSPPSGKPGRWYVVLSCDDVPAEPLEPAGSSAGIDMGVASFLTTSDGTHVPNPRHLAATSRAARGGPARPRPQETRRQQAEGGGREGRQAAREGPPPAAGPRPQDRLGPSPRL